MSRRLEWDEPDTCPVKIAPNYDVDTAIVEPYVLIIGGAGGGALALPGTAEQLLAFAQRLTATVRKELDETYTAEHENALHTSAEQHCPVCQQDGPTVRV